MSRRTEFLDAKVYVGGLPDDARSEEVEDVFRKFGKVRKVWVARRPPGFAFVEFEDFRDAEDAVRYLDGSRICGVRAKVEMSHGRPRGVGCGRDGVVGGYHRRSRSPIPRRRSRSPRDRRSPGRSLSRSKSPIRNDRDGARRSSSRSRSRSRSP